MFLPCVLLLFVVVVVVRERCWLNNDPALIDFDFRFLGCV